MLASPYIPKLETVNDKDGFLCNFWRAVQRDPGKVAQYADQPNHESTLHARHAWLVSQRATLTARLEGDPDFYDVKSAGWWCWGLCLWIGKAWCSGKGPWHAVDGRLTKGAVRGQGIWRQRPELGGYLHQTGEGVHSLRARDGGVYAWMHTLCERLRYVRVCCGDWTRVMTPTITYKHGLTGIVLDPPYSHSERDSALYATEANIPEDIQMWCLANGDNPLLRIVLCGLSGEYTLPGWRTVSWTAQGGMVKLSRQSFSGNKYRERLYLSPHCLYPRKHRIRRKLAVKVGA